MMALRIYHRVHGKDPLGTVRVKDGKAVPDESVKLLVETTEVRVPVTNTLLTPKDGERYLAGLDIALRRSSYIGVERFEDDGEEETG